MFFWKTKNHESLDWSDTLEKVLEQMKLRGIMGDYIERKSDGLVIARVVVYENPIYLEEQTRAMMGAKK